MDTFDPKPRLADYHGKPFPMAMAPTQFNNNGNTLASPWKFSQHGQSGIPISELFPNLGRVADELCVVRSMTSEFSEHTNANYFLHTSDVTFDMRENRMEVHERHAEPWRVTLVDTGDLSMTGGRLKRVRRYVENDAAFFFTYGDGLGDIDLAALMRFHEGQGQAATVTAVVPPGRFGALELDGPRVSDFTEKPAGDGSMINGGFFILSPAVIDLIDGDDTIWENQPIAELIRRDQLRAFRHTGFWQPMDTLREKNQLEALWASGKAPWKCWG